MRGSNLAGGEGRNLAVATKMNPGIESTIDPVLAQKKDVDPVQGEGKVSSVTGFIILVYTLLQLHHGFHKVVNLLYHARCTTVIASAILGMLITKTP